MENIKKHLIWPLARMTAWLAFSVLFFYSGLYFTEWLLAPPDAPAAGVLRGLLIVLFPFLVPLFFVVNRLTGCAGGACRSGRATVCRNRERNAGINVKNMPGA